MGHQPVDPVGVSVREALHMPLETRPTELDSERTVELPHTLVLGAENADGRSSRSATSALETRSWWAST